MDRVRNDLTNLALKRRLLYQLSYRSVNPVCCGLAPPFHLKVGRSNPWALVIETHPTLNAHTETYIQICCFNCIKVLKVCQTSS